jgi:hypothetical protein
MREEQQDEERGGQHQQGTCHDKVHKALCASQNIDPDEPEE